MITLQVYYGNTSHHGNITLLRTCDCIAEIGIIYMIMYNIPVLHYFLSVKIHPFIGNKHPVTELEICTTIHIVLSWRSIIVLMKQIQASAQLFYVLIIKQYNSELMSF